MEIAPLGDSALLVRVRDDFADPDGTVTEVLAAQRAIEAAQLPGVIEVAPAYTTVAVFYDPVRAIEGGASVNDVFAWLKPRIRAALVDGRIAPRRTTRVIRRAVDNSRRYKRAVEIPVCYDPDFALDLEHIAENARLSPREVVDLHSGAQYRVHCVGFTPGFPFLGGLDPRLATPRRSTPRKEIAAGSVGIGGAQTGVYPVKSPGGWNIVGRTPLRLFDPAKNPPALLRAGNRVRFRAITPEEFEALKR